MVVQRTVSFQTRDGLTLRGWLFSPDESEVKRPCIVLAHGFSAVKEMSLDNFGKVFAENGMHALVYDNRNLGESDGEPRFELVPVMQIDDYKDAITFASTLPQVDAARIGAWGSSYSGGHVLRVAAEDRRVKCVVSQVQLVSGFAMWKTLPEQAREAMLEAFAADRLNRFQGKEPAMLAVTSHDSSIPSALPTPDSADFFLDFKKANPENAWENKVTLRSLEHLFGYEPGAAIPHIAPTPLLMVVAKTDSLVSSDIAVKAFETAGEPKKFIMLECGHFEPYDGEWFAKNAPEQIAWFKEHLKP